MLGIFDRENYDIFWEVCIFRIMICKLIFKKLFIMFFDFFNLFSFVCYL